MLCNIVSSDMSYFRNCWCLSVLGMWQEQLHYWCLFRSDRSVNIIIIFGVIHRRHPYRGGTGVVSKWTNVDMRGYLSYSVRLQA